MASTRLLTTIGLTLLVYGCAFSNHASGLRASETAAVPYACRPSDPLDGSAPAMVRHVAARRAPDRSSVTLILDHGREEMLQALNGSERTYADHVFGWRYGDPVSTLTDIAAIETYSCTRATDRVAAR